MRRALSQTKTVPLVALGLIGGWAMVDLTGSRFLGGVVLFALGCCAGFVWLFRDGVRTTVTLAVVYLACFVAAHILGLITGSWPAVILVAVVSAAAAYAYSDRRISASN